MPTDQNPVFQLLPVQGVKNWPPDSLVKARDVPESHLVAASHQEIQHLGVSSEDRALESLLNGV